MRKICIFALVGFISAACPNSPGPNSKNETWVAKDTNGKTLFLAVGGFSILTAFNHDNESCPYYLNFELKNSIVTARTDESKLTVIMDQRQWHCIFIKLMYQMHHKYIKEYCHL